MAEELKGVPYQSQPQVHQLLAERANADALGLTDRMAAIDKQLDQFGYDPKGKKDKAAEKRAKAAEDDEDAKSETPKGRAAPKSSATG